jgi:hypothetical protein
VDVITNSSSELFVFGGKSKEAVIDMLKMIYPNYLNEYIEVKSVQELTADELDMYCSYKYNHWNNMFQCFMHEVPNGILEDEMYSPSTWKGSKGELEIDVKKIAKNSEKIKKAIDPTGNIFFLFSKNENPNWEFQQLLENVGFRYHLG